MKKWLFLPICLILMSFAWLVQTGNKTLNDSKYSITYPATWEVFRDTGQIDYYIYPPEDKDPSFNENIVVRHTDLAGKKITFAEFNTQTKTGINQLFKNVAFLVDKDVTGKNGKYHELVYTGTYNGQAYKMKQLFFLQYGYSYILIYTAKSTTYDVNEKEATAIMASFKPKIPKK